MTIPTIPFNQLLTIMRHVKSTGATIIVADKDEPPHLKMYEEMQRRRQEEEDDDDDDDDDDDYYYSCCRRRR